MIRDGKLRTYVNRENYQMREYAVLWVNHSFYAQDFSLKELIRRYKYVDEQYWRKHKRHVSAHITTAKGVEIWHNYK